MKKVPIAVLASGRGSNFDAIHAAIEAGALGAEIRLVLSDNPAAPVLEKARAKGLNAVCVQPQKGIARLEHEKRVFQELSKHSPRFLVLAGYMRIMTEYLIEAFRSERGYSRIVNVHPSLLPAFPGVGAYRQAFEHGVKTTGVTVHLLESQVDAGPICAQQSFEIDDCQSAEDVEKRGLAIEHRLFPEALKWILPEAFSLERRAVGNGGTGRFSVRPN